MKRYKLKRDLPTFKAGEIFRLSDAGNLFRESDNVPAYGWTILNKFPNILTDWFEEINESTRWKPKERQDYYCVTSDGSVVKDDWSNWCLDDGRFEIGNCFQTEEEAERIKEYLKALAVVRGGATSKFTKGRDNWYVYYDTDSNSLESSISRSMLDNGIFGLPYFATTEDAKRSIEQHKKEWLTIFGVKEEKCD